MAKLLGEYEIRIGDDGLIVLREPTNEEWADFSRKTSVRYIKGRARPRKRKEILEARCGLFDLLVTSIENIEDKTGPITMDTLDRIHGRLKEAWILEKFELPVIPKEDEDEDEDGGTEKNL
jgi:hypothetical protein